jgi:hypothetical protein
MSYFDRMLWQKEATSLSCSSPLCNTELLAVTCVYLAVKLFERMEKRSYLLRDLVLMSREKFTKEQIIEMESQILSSLSWHVHPTTSQLFSFHFLKLISRNALIHAAHNGTTVKIVENFDRNIRKVLEIANYIIELATFDSSLVNERPSTIAGAAIQLAMKELKLKNLPGATDIFHHGMYAANTNTGRRQTNQWCSKKNNSYLLSIYDILPSETSLCFVEAKLQAFLESHTSTLGELQQPV